MAAPIVLPTSNEKEHGIGREANKTAVQALRATNQSSVSPDHPLAFLILAAQYGSWSMPLAVLLIAPMALLSAIGGVWCMGGDNNIFTQIGFIVLVGLAAKNAILIVEFARAQEEQGLDAVAAALEAAGLGLRPVLTTSIAFVAGVVPLAVATGAGAEMRQAMGVAVFFGMLGVTVVGLILTPVL